MSMLTLVQNILSNKNKACSDSLMIKKNLLFIRRVTKDNKYKKNGAPKLTSKNKKTNLMCVKILMKKILPRFLVMNIKEFEYQVFFYLSSKNCICAITITTIKKAACESRRRRGNSSMMMMTLLAKKGVVVTK